jgi:hypothetical protein
MMRTTLELTKVQGNWVLCTSNVVIRFTPEAVYFNNENGSLKLPTVPVAAITQASAFHDGRRLCLVILHGQRRDGSWCYRMYAKTNTDGVEEPAFQLRLTLNSDGGVDSLFVSDAVRVNDFLRSFLAAMLMKHHIACAETVEMVVQSSNYAIASSSTGA